MHGYNPQFQSLGELFYKCLRKDGVIQYLDDINEKTTQLDLLRWSIRAAIKLKKMGITRQDIVSTCTHNQKYSPVPLIASQLLGVMNSNFDPNLSHLDTIHLLKLTQPKILFVAEESLNFIETCLQKAGVSTDIVVFGESKKYKQFSEFLEPSEDEEFFQLEETVKDTDTAIIFFSSGTTGLPKGICMSHKALIRATGREGIFSDTNTVTLMYSTLYWIGRAFFLIRSARFGHSYVIRADFDPEYTWRLIEKYKVTSIFITPHLAIEFVKNKPANVDTSGLEFFFIGGSAQPSKLIGNLKELLPQTKIYNAYGQTEVGGLITTFNILSSEDCNLQLKKPLSCGKILEDMEWKVVDVNTEKSLGPNEKGELRIKLDGYLVSGYYKIDSSSAYDAEGYLKTGDMVYYDEDECFYVVGRLKEMFKYRGWHILPNIIEDIIMCHPAVKEAAIIGIPHEIDGDHVMAVVVLFDGYDKNCAKKIKEFVNGKVADSQQLRAGVEIVDSLPKTTTNKIRRNLLRKMMIDRIKNST